MTNPGPVGLKAWWTFDNRSGNWRDYISNIPLAQNSGAQPVLVTDPKLGRGAVDFSGHDDCYLTTPAQAAIQIADETPYEVGFWFNPDAIASGPKNLLCMWDESATERSWGIFHWLGNDLSLQVRNTSDTSNSTLEADNFGALTNGTWYFVQMYYNPVANQAGLGVNGTFDTLSYSGINTSSAPLMVGSGELALGQQNSVNGQIDELYICNGRQYTTAERSWLYASGAGRRVWEVMEGRPAKVAWLHSAAARLSPRRTTEVYPT